MTGTLTLLIMEQGQPGVLTLYHKWLHVVVKLKIQTACCVLPDSRRHLTAFEPNLGVRTCRAPRTSSQTRLQLLIIYVPTIS